MIFFMTVEDTIGVKPVEPIKLVELSCSLSHGQAGSERGFADTKGTVVDRSSMSDRSVKDLKIVREAVQIFGFAERVPITASLLNDVKQAHSLKMQEERKEKKMKLLKLKLFLKEQGDT